MKNQDNLRALLRESVLQLCKVGIEDPKSYCIDAIICLTRLEQGEETDEELVIKIHTPLVNQHLKSLKKDDKETQNVSCQTSVAVQAQEATNTSSGSCSPMPKVEKSSTDNSNNDCAVLDADAEIGVQTDTGKYHELNYCADTDSDSTIIGTHEKTVGAAVPVVVLQRLNTGSILQMQADLPKRVQDGDHEESCPAKIHHNSDMENLTASSKGDKSAPKIIWLHSSDSEEEANWQTSKAKRKKSNIHHSTSVCESTCTETATCSKVPCAIPKLSDINRSMDDPVESSQIDFGLQTQPHMIDNSGCAASSPTVTSQSDIQPVFPHSNWMSVSISNKKLKRNMDTDKKGAKSCNLQFSNADSSKTDLSSTNTKKRRIVLSTPILNEAAKVASAITNKIQTEIKAETGSADEQSADEQSNQQPMPASSPTVTSQSDIQPVILYGPGSSSIKIVPTKPYCCSFCGQIFKATLSFEDHVLQNHGFYPCLLCSEVYARKQERNNHFKRHVKDRLQQSKLT